ncbi:MAG: protein phosphatase 2C domain-containing protein [Planctomycetia bacterium]|nr:protein phosphatase 2C domain-containing protein [Planctomycetia bacterium]
MPAFEPLQYAALTDVGVKRSHNQDACAAQPAVDPSGFEASGHVFVVADGMGGHAVGEKASAKAVRDIPFLYSKHARDGIIPAIRRAFQETNAGIYAIGQENPEFRGMGTTSTALILRPEGAWVGHVGDSRAYRIRDGKAEQLTFDHSWVWEIAKRQGVDPDELGDFKKNVIIRSLGPDPEVEVDIEGPYPVLPGDAFLLCSDGLTGVVHPQEVGAVVTTLAPEEAARFLVHLANLRGGPDNITVLIVWTPGGKGPGGSATVARREGGLSRLFSAWNRLIPWPFTVLGGGCLVAGLSLVMQMNEVPGATILFILAAGLILAGLVGLVLHLQKEDPTGGVEIAADSTPRELHVYKKHDCAVSKEVSEKFAQIEAQLLESMRGQSVPADYDAHGRLLEAADAAVRKGDPIAAFRARCASLLFLAEAFHKARHKQESFQPSWTPSSTS